VQQECLLQVIEVLDKRFKQITLFEGWEELVLDVPDYELEISNFDAEIRKLKKDVELAVDQNHKYMYGALNKKALK
jgi:hypothetical protein